MKFDLRRSPFLSRARTGLLPTTLRHPGRPYYTCKIVQKSELTHARVLNKWLVRIIVHCMVDLSTLVGAQKCISRGALRTLATRPIGRI